MRKHPGVMWGAALVLLIAMASSSERPTPATSDGIEIVGTWTKPIVQPAMDVSYPVQFTQGTGGKNRTFTNHWVYPSGEPMVLGLGMFNTGSGPGMSGALHLDPYIPVLEIVRADDGALVWRAGVLGGPTDLAANEEVGASVQWDQKDLHGKQVAPGTYWLKMGKFLMSGTTDGQGFLVQISQGFYPQYEVFEIAGPEPQHG